MPTTTRAIPAATMASTHGGVRPWWLQGSSVDTSVAPRAGVTGTAQRLALGVRAARRLGGAGAR